MKTRDISEALVYRNRATWLYGTGFIAIMVLYLSVLLLTQVIDWQDPLWPTFGKPLVIMFYLIYIPLTLYFFRKRTGMIIGWLQKPDAHRLEEIQRVIYYLPRFMALMIFIFPNLAAIVHISQFKNIDLDDFIGWLFNFVFGVLIPIPFFFYAYRNIEKMTADVPPSRVRRSLALKYKIAGNVLITAIGIILLFTVSNIAFVAVGIRDGGMNVESELTDKLMIMAAQKNGILALFAIIIAFGSYFLLRDTIVKPIEEISNVTDAISEGNLNTEIHFVERDEIGALASSLQNVQRVVGLVNTEFKSLTHSVLDGDLSARAHGEKLQGEWKGLFDGINGLIDAFVAPLRLSIDYLNRISLGEVPEKITDNYNGDFNQIKDSCNRLIDASLLLSQKAHLVAGGDLTINLDKRSEGDTMMQSLSDMVQAIARTIAQISTVAQEVTASGEQVSNIASQVSHGAAEQAASTEELSSTIEEFSTSVKQNAENALQAESIASSVAQRIETVKESVLMSNEAMKNIVQKISIINEIAERTDLLAINAAIEAANAGEHGKGFAVVASEVRQLAEHSLNAANIIDEVSRNSLQKAESSLALLNQISPDIEMTSRFVKEISAASVEQSTGASEVNRALHQLSLVTQQNSASAEEMEGNAEIMSDLAVKLLGIIDFFKTSQEDKNRKNRLQIEAEIRKLQEALRRMSPEVSPRNSLNNKGKGNYRLSSRPLNDLPDGEFENWSDE